MTKFRQYLADRLSEAERIAETWRPGEDADDSERALYLAHMTAVHALRAALKRYDAEHPSNPAHDPLTCPCCVRYGAHIVAMEEERAELIALTEEIREAGRALATLAEHRMDGCHGAHGPKGRCPGCERDDAISVWARANWRWSTRERAGGQSDG